jgi:PAS domain S-box-containing protein
MAAGFFEIYGTHVIVADTQLQMLINTRLPLGAPLPKLPVPAGRSAVALVLSTGKPAFGDSFVGPIAGTTLAALCVPVLRDGQVMALVLTTVDADYFLSRMPTLAMPAEWTLSVRDSTGAVMARLGPAAAGAASAHPFQSSLGASGWSVHLEIPNAAYRRPVLVASAVMLLVLGLAVAAALLAGSVASRRLRDALLRLASAPGPTASKASGIAEVDALDRQLGEARSALGASERSYRVLFEDHPHPMFVLDAKSYRFIAVNGAALTHYGYSREEFLAMTVADIRPEEDRPRLAAFLEGLRPREAPAMSALGVWTHRLKDGRLIEVEVSSSEIEF